MKCIFHKWSKAETYNKKINKDITQIEEDGNNLIENKMYLLEHWSLRYCIKCNKSQNKLTKTYLLKGD